MEQLSAQKEKDWKGLFDLMEVGGCKWEMRLGNVKM